MLGRERRPAHAPIPVVRVARHKNVTLSDGCGTEEQIRHAGVRRVSETCISFALRIADDIVTTAQSQQHDARTHP
jgi:hypothetical protein